MKMLYVPVRIKQNRSSPTMPGSPINAQLRKYRHSPFTGEKQQKSQLKFIFFFLSKLMENCVFFFIEIDQTIFCFSSKWITKFKISQNSSPFWRVFRHIVGRTPGKWSKLATWLQSVIDNVLLSKGSPHLGSESDRHSQHLIAKPK